MQSHHAVRRVLHAAPTRDALVGKLGVCAMFSTSTKTSCPYRILGVPKSSSFAHAKDAFLKLALMYHPDTSANKAENGSTFAQLREALETIKDNQHEKHDSARKEDLEEWFTRSTGGLSFYMDAGTRREVAVASTMAQGGLDRGGMWKMARDVAQREAENPSEDSKELGAGASTTTKRRKR